MRSEREFFPDSKGCCNDQQSDFLCDCGRQLGLRLWFYPTSGQQWCRPDKAFPPGEFAVFYDYGSLMQKDAKGQRTEEEADSFGIAIETMVSTSYLHPAPSGATSPHCHASPAHHTGRLVRSSAVDHLHPE